MRPALSWRRISCATRRSNERRGRGDAELPLAGLRPGPYRLRVTARSGESEATREVGILVMDEMNHRDQ